MPKTSPLWLSAALLAFLSVSSLADSITLKSGDKVEGRIVSETETEVVIEEKISATITDQRAIPKADVAKIDKDDPSIAAWEALKNYKPGANSLPAASYLPVIGALTNFATTHTASPHAEEAKKAAAEFQEEQKRVEAGDVKLAGKWLTAEEAEKERYQINGLIAFNYMKDQAARRDWLGVLNSFSVLEKNFRGSRSYPDGVETARKVLEALKGDVERQKQALAAQKKEREQGMKLANAAQKAEMADVQKKEAAAADAAMATAQKQGLKWPPLIPRSEKSVAAIAAKIPTEQQALTRVDTAKLRQSIQAAEKLRLRSRSRNWPMRKSWSRRPRRSGRRMNSPSG
jgi:chemotaxis protein histidine kinase CheA